MSIHSSTVAVIICTRDRPDDLALCLHSIEDQSVQPDEIIIVSGSDESLCPGIDDGSCHLPIRVVDCYENNISKSRNAGLEAATAELILFIDDDAVAHAEWIRSYIEAFAANPDVWAIGGDVYDTSCTPGTLEFSRGLISSFGLQIPVRGDASIDRPGGYFMNVKGCNFGIRREEVMHHGRFDPFYVFSFEESDLIMMIHRAGGGVMHERRAVVDHSHSYGFYRQNGWMDRNWRVEYASHTMFMLKHTGRYQRFIGRLLIYRRFLKLSLFAVLDVFRGVRGVSECAGIIREAWRGIGDAYREFALRSSVGSGDCFTVQE